MKTYIFLVLHPDGTATHADIHALCSADAVRAVCIMYPDCRFNIVNVCAL